MNHNQFNSTPSSDAQGVIIIKEKSKTCGILGLVFGLLSVFIMAILFVPLGIIFSVLGILKRDTINLILGVSGLILSLIGVMTSPLLMGLIGLGFMR